MWRCFSGLALHDGAFEADISADADISAGRFVANSREQSATHGVYLDVFEQSVLTDRSGKRTLSLLASISGELVVVSALIIIPLTYNEHLPDFHWKSTAVGAPLKRIAPKPVPAGALRRASNGLSFPRTFVEPSPAPRAGVSSLNPEPGTWEPPAIAAVTDSVSPAPSRAIDISSNVAPIAPPTVTKPQPLPPAPIRVSAGIQMAKLLKKVVPDYPPLARSARVSGVVHLVGIIARDGTIRDLQLISGHPLLARAAMQAVEQWVYQPTLLSGQPVEVIAPIDVYFTLGQ